MFYSSANLGVFCLTVSLSPSYHYFLDECYFLLFTSPFITRFGVTQTEGLLCKWQSLWYRLFSGKPLRFHGMAVFHLSPKHRARWEENIEPATVKGPICINNGNKVSAYWRKRETGPLPVKPIRKKQHNHSQLASKPVLPLWSTTGWMNTSGVLLKQNKKNYP